MFRHSNIDIYTFYFSVLSNFRESQVSLFKSLIYTKDHS